MHGIHGGRNALLDRKMVEKVIQKLDTLSRLNGALQLQRSHPFLPDITREMKDQLRQILDKNSSIGQNQYLQVTIPSLLSKTDNCTEVISRQGIVDRRTIAKQSLIFSHILCELRALFPGGRFQGNGYRVAKMEAAAFWSQAFGTRCLVRWEEFRERLNRIHNIEAGPLESALRSTMDLTCNDYISVFEFDIFTRLFQPWETLLQNWMLLAVTHPAYMAFLTYDEVKDILQNHIYRPGSYIFRLSCTHLGQWAIGYVTSSGNILQTIPQKSLYEALNEGEKEGLYIYPNGLNTKHSLPDFSKSNPDTVIHVTQEQWELYSDMDSSFELCKICADNQKDIQIKPCGHLLCEKCLTSWQKNDNTCPFCRSGITGKEKIHIASPPEERAVNHTAISNPPTTADAPPQVESAASADWVSTLTEHFVDDEEIDWIRNRPLPPPPGAPALPDFHPSISTSRVVASAPPLDLRPPLAPRPSLPPLPSGRPMPFARRGKLHARDIIKGSHN
ncbi:E3 ubiquitin-protein ligase CBL-C [Gastrophryne carolinensis]